MSTPLRNQIVPFGLAAALVLSFLMFAGAGLGASVEPILVLGASNRTCDEFDDAWSELKVDPPADGVYSNGDLTVTVSGYDGSKHFNWSSDAPVSAVFVKAGSRGHYLYVYDPPATSDTGLQSPEERGNAISHIAFCYVPDGGGGEQGGGELSVSDISLAKTADAATAYPGDQIGFTLLLESFGPDPAANVTLSDALPAIAGAWSLDPVDGCALDAGNVSCAFASLDVGAAVSIHVTATATAADCGDILNVASADALDDLDADNNQAAAAIHVACPDVAVEKSADDTFVAGGAAIAFEMTVRSIGSDPADDVVLDDILPFLTLDSWSLAGPDASACALDGLVLSCAFGTLQPGENRTVRVEATSCRADCGDLLNNATVSAAHDIDPANDAASAAIHITCVCPHTQGYWKNHPEAWPVAGLTIGDETYTQAQLLALLRTPVKGDASMILAHQLIAAKLGIAAGADDEAAAASVAAADALLAPYAGLLPYKIKASSVAGHAMTDVADTLDAFNNGLLTPGCAGSVEVAKDAAVADVPVGDEMRFDITVTSTGPGAVTGVVLDDALPALADEQAWQVDGADAGVCTLEAGALRCVFLTMAVGEERHVSVFATATSEGLVSNTATASFETRDGAGQSADGADILVFVPV